MIQCFKLYSKCYQLSKIVLWECEYLDTNISKLLKIFNTYFIFYKIIFDSSLFTESSIPCITLFQQLSRHKLFTYCIDSVNSNTLQAFILVHIIWDIHTSWLFFIKQHQHLCRLKIKYLMFIFCICKTFII